MYHFLKISFTENTVLGKLKVCIMWYCECCIEAGGNFHYDLKYSDGQLENT